MTTVEAPLPVTLRGSQLRRQLQIRVSAVFVGLIGLLLLAGAVMETYTRTVVVLGLAMAILGFGISTMYTYLGMVCLSAAGFAAIGTYVTMIALSDWGWPLPVALLAAGVAACVVAAILAPIIFRLEGIYFALVTFALSEVITHLIGRYESLTGGQLGKSLRYSGSPFPGTSDQAYGTYLFAGTLVVLLTCISLVYRRSQRGIRSIALGDDDAVATALGLRARPYLFVHFAACGFICGLGGAVLAFHLRFVEPSFFGPSLSIGALAVVIVGGARVVPGPLIGAMAVEVLPELLEVSPLVRIWLYGGGLILVILAFNDGIGGALVKGWGHLRRFARRSAAR